MITAANSSQQQPTAANSSQQQPNAYLIGYYHKKLRSDRLLIFGFI